MTVTEDAEPLRALQIVGVAVRLFAVVEVIAAIRYATGWLLALEEPAFGTVAGIVVGGIVLPVAFALWLWFFPLTVAKAICPRVRTEPEPVPVDAEQAVSVGLALLGVWVLASAVPDAMFWVGLAWIQNREYPIVDFTAEQRANVLATIAELAVGALLLFGKRGIVTLVHRFRFGRPD